MYGGDKDKATQVADRAKRDGRVKKDNEFPDKEEENYYWVCVNVGELVTAQVSEQSHALHAEAEVDATTAGDLSSLMSAPPAIMGMGDQASRAFYAAVEGLCIKWVRSHTDVPKLPARPPAHHRNAHHHNKIGN